LAAFGAGGTETLIFGYLLREEEQLRTCFRDMLSGSKSRIIVSAFYVPDHEPYPLLHYDFTELNARILLDESVEPQPAVAR
jgi:hypothetical protein